MENQNILNINRSVKVRLTKLGIKELKKYHLDLCPHLEWREPIVDEDGYTIFILHELIKQLGHLCNIGFNVPFEPNIIVLDEDY